MLLGNIKKENVYDSNQCNSDLNLIPGNYVSVNQNNGLSLNYQDYNFSVNTLDNSINQRWNTADDYSNVINPNSVTNSVSNQNMSTSSGVGHNAVSYPLMNVPDSNKYKYQNNVSMTSPHYHQYNNFNSPPPGTFFRGMNENLSGTNTLITNSQSCNDRYSGNAYCYYSNNRNSITESNNIDHRLFNTSGNDIGIISHSQLAQPIASSDTANLSHSFNNLTFNNSIQPTQLHANNMTKESQIYNQNNVSVGIPEFASKPGNLNNIANNGFNIVSNFNSSSQSLPHACLKPNHFPNSNFLNIPTSMSISTPAVVPERERINLNSGSNNRPKLAPPHGSHQSISGHISSRLSPSRRMIDVMEERKLIPPTGIMNPVPNLMHITKKPNCNPSIMRCTMNSVPCSEEILNKTRLPLAIMIHPFKDLANLQVIRSQKIVRCATLSCRTYLNPFVMLSDQRRWKCNLCQRTNELTDDYLYDESLGEYIETQKRAEFRMATVEYVAPREYSMRAFKLPVYVFMIDISINAVYTLYQNTLNRILTTIDELLDRLPGHEQARFALIGYDNHIHFYSIAERKFQEIVLSDISSPIEIPTTTGILVDIHKYRDQIQEILMSLLDNVDSDLSIPSHAAPNCLGSALLVAKQLISNCGGRITIFNASCPSVGEGVLTIRDNKKSGAVFPIVPDKEFYKSLSLECLEAQIGVDLFQLGNLPCDLASLSIVTRYCGGSLYHYPDLTFRSLIKENENPNDSDKCLLEIQRLNYDLNRYLTRKIGFDAVLRVRFSSGFTIQSTHGNFFARACDLYAMATINPDSSMSIRLSISDNIIDNNVVYFQAALLYTSSLGERRIRVHTLCLPVSSQIDDVFRMADHQAIAVLLAKSVSDRLQFNGKVVEAREALINAIADPSTAFGECCLNSSQRLTSLPFPYHLRLLPLYVWGILQSKCLLTVQNDPDRSVAILDSWRNMPQSYLLVDLYPSLYNITSVAFLSCKQKEKFNSVIESLDKSGSCSPSDDLDSNLDDTVEPAYSSDSEASSWDSEDGISCYDSRNNYGDDVDNLDKIKQIGPVESEDDDLWYPEQLHLSMQSLKRSEVYLLESSHGLIMLMGSETPRGFFNQIFGVESVSELPIDGNIQLPELNNAASIQLRIFIKNLQIERPIGSNLFVINNMRSDLNTVFQSQLIEDDKLDASYHRFLKHIQRKVNK